MKSQAKIPLAAEAKEKGEQMEGKGLFILTQTELLEKII